MSGFKRLCPLIQLLCLTATITLPGCRDNKRQEGQRKGVVVDEGNMAGVDYQWRGVQSSFEVTAKEIDRTYHKTHESKEVVVFRGAKLGIVVVGPEWASLQGDFPAAILYVTGTEEAVENILELWSGKTVILSPGPRGQESVEDIVRAQVSLDDVAKISSALEYLEITVALEAEQLAILKAVHDVPSAEAGKAGYHSVDRKQKALAKKTEQYKQMSFDGEEGVRAGRMLRKMVELTQKVPQERRRVEKIPGLPKDFWAPPYEGPVGKAVLRLKDND